MTSKRQHTQGTHGVQLLELTNSNIKQTSLGEADVELAHGDLRVLLVTIDLSDPFHDSASQGQEASTGKAGGAEKIEPESDIWLVLQIGSNFSLPIKSIQTVIPERSSNSYLFKSDEIPGVGVRLTTDKSSSADSIEQFEDLLSQYCAYHDDRSDPVDHTNTEQGQVELMDEKGVIMGKLVIDSGIRLEEDPRLREQEHSKSPVLLELPSTDHTSRDGPVHVRPVPIDAQQVGKGAESADDWLIKGASFISRGIVTSAAYGGSALKKAANSYTARTAGKNIGENFAATTATDRKASALDTHPVHFATPSRATKGAATLQSASAKAVSISHATTKAILDVASGVGSKIGRTTGIQAKRNPDGTAGPPPKGVRGVINRGLVAASVVLDGIDAGAQTLLESGGDAAGAVIAHRFGNEARVLAGHTGHATRNVFLVYKDISGVRRKCLLKVAGGTFRARLDDDGSEVIMQVDDSGEMQASQTTASSSSTILPSPSRSHSKVAGK